LPVFEHAGHMSEKVYFIISGQIHIMNKEGLYEYGILQDGSYFGDISLLLNEENDYSYYYNPNADKAIKMLTVPAETFLKICDMFPLSKEILVNRAQKRRQIFENFK
jgi:CRP-like cAMP-binding protein